MPTVNQVATKFRDWIKAPFRADGDLLDWFLFIAFVLVAIVVWRHIFAMIDVEV